VNNRIQELVTIPALPWTLDLICNYPDCTHISISGYTKCRSHFRLYKLAELPHYTNIQPEGYVYLLQEHSTEYWKIGSSFEPVLRAKDIQIGTPHAYKDLLMYYTSDRIRAERYLQAFYLNYNIRSEWYDLSHVVELDLQCKVVLEHEMVP
jgi:hypothetical protein